MITIAMFDQVGEFAEDKDVARDLRLREIIPALDADESIVLDFEKVNSVTQSFMHALISDLFRNYGNDVLDRVTFKSCSDTVKKIITIVADYMQESE